MSEYPTCQGTDFSLLNSILTGMLISEAISFAQCAFIKVSTDFRSNFRPSPLFLDSPLENIYRPLILAGLL